MGKNSNFSKKIRLDREILDWAQETGRLGWERDDRNPDDYADAFYADQMKNYDVRRSMEAFNLAKSDEAFRDSLGSKKLSKFVDSYKTNKKAKGKEKDGQIIGLSNANELGTIREFQKLYHKNVRNKAGKYDDQNDYGGGTRHMMDAMRNYYGGSFAKDTEPEKKPKVKKPKSLLPKNYTPSEETASAQDFVSQYERSIRDSPDGLLNTGSMGESQTLKGTSFNAEDASEENDKAQGFFQDQLLNLTEGFKKYNINTVGPNSTASKNRDLLRSFSTT